MIFRYLYKRRIFKLFGPYMDRAQLDALFDTTSEWQALKSFLPQRWFYSVEQRKAARLQVIKSIKQVLDKRFSDGVYRTNPEELSGIERGLKDAREGRFATDEQVKAAFDKFRRA